VLLVKAPETMQVVVVAPGVHAPRVTTYVPKLDEFGPVPFSVMFCALWPRFRVTVAACPMQAVNNNPPNKQKTLLWRGASFAFLFAAFIK
jgi:hypothetical protein